MTSKRISAGYAALLFFLSIPAARVFGLEAGGGRQRLDALRSGIKEKGARWTAGETSLSGLSFEELRLKAGLFEQLNAAPLLEKPMADLPAAADWRSFNGNYVGTVKEQGKCNSCWAFALTGGLESHLMITRGKPGENLDLAEQILVSCSGFGSCRGGSLYANYLRRTGLPPERFYPYTAADGPCEAAQPGWQQDAYRAEEWDSVPNKLYDLKSALVRYGPLPAAMIMYEDLAHYKAGVYSYVSGKKVGDHAVLIIGYDDPGGYFIARNSWGTNWGENGFFRIAYSEMGSVVSFAYDSVVFRSGAAAGPR